MLGTLTKQPLSRDNRDSWVWKRRTSSIISVKVVYLEIEKKNCCQARPRNKAIFFKCIWSSTAPFKAQTLGRRLVWNKLPTFDNLSKHIDTSGMDGRCCFCRTTEDSCQYLFNDCPKIREVWVDLVSWIGVAWAAPSNPSSHLHSSHLLGNSKGVKNLSGLWICTTWVWWKWRNAITFEQER